MLGPKRQSMTVKESAILKLLWSIKEGYLTGSKRLKDFGAKATILRAGAWMFLYRTCANTFATDPSVEIKNIHGKGYVLNC